MKHITNEMRTSPKIISLIIITVLFAIIWLSNEIQEKMAFLLLYVGTVAIILVYFKVDDLNTKCLTYQSYYYKNEFLGKTFTFNDRTFRIKKFIAIGNDGLENKFECICLQSGTKEYWYENELLQALAKEDAVFLGGDE